MAVVVLVGQRLQRLLGVVVLVLQGLVETLLAELEALLVQMVAQLVQEVCLQTRKAILGEGLAAAVLLRAQLAGQVALQ